MRHQFIRRTSALVLALVLSISLAAPAWAVAADETEPPDTSPEMNAAYEASPGEASPGDSEATVPVTGVTLNKTTLALAVDGTETLTATVAPSDATNKTVTWTSSDASVATVSNGTVTAVKVGTATITATTEDGGHTATCAVTVSEVSATGIKLDQTVIERLAAGGKVELKATVSPQNATDKVEWKSSDEKVVTVAVSKDDDKICTVTGVSCGTATITATAGGYSATCTVTVPIILTIAGESYWTNTTTASQKVLSAQLSGVPQGTTPTIQWTAKPKTARPGEVPPIFSGAGVTKVEYQYAEDGKTVIGVTATGGQEVTVNDQTPGEFVITASYTAADGKTYTSEMNLTVSGILLSGSNLKAVTDTNALKTQKTLDMVVNGSGVLSAALIGDADGRDVRMEWTSSDAGVVSVMPDAGNLNAWMEGTAEIYVTTTDGKYSTYCKVTVGEDKSVLVEKKNDGTPITASLSQPPLTFDVFYKELERICQKKISETYGDGENGTLDYITNLSVATDQGTLYYNYNSESDTGEGVGASDQFTDPAKALGARHGVDKLYFVPKQGFSGTVDITFRAVSGTRSFSGIIRVTVNAGPGGGVSQISYTTRAGEAVWFSVNDFDAFCQGPKGNGRSFSYVIFNLPKSSDGVLYYNYMAGSGVQVATNTRFSRSGRYSLDDVCFVPNAALKNNSVVTISFRAVDTSGAVIDGTVTVNVTAANVGADPSSVVVSGERGRPVTLQSSLFYSACQKTIGDTLSFVTFTLPDPATEGVLYYNYRSSGSYDSRVTAGTHYYYSGVPGLSSISFVPASSASGRVAISYTGYGAGGASYSGTLYIELGEADRSTIYYSVQKGGTVTFNVTDFYNAGLYAVGGSVSYVIFRSKTGGSLHYNNSNSAMTLPGASSTTTLSTYRYYRSPTGTQKALNKVAFWAEDMAGPVTITYDAYDSSGKWLFKGIVEIQVGSVTVKDIKLSCRNGEHTTATELRTLLSSECGAVMNAGLSYIVITSVPDPEKGRLYADYVGFGTGRVVEPGDRFYSYGSPSVSQLRFVPRAGFSGEAEITYIAYSFVYTDAAKQQKQDQVSGRILVDVTRSIRSRNFTDMSGSFSWASDSVDYLYRNNAVAGRGNGLFDPRGTITKGDFTLMIVSAYGLTADGKISFNDVPKNSYYADAIRVAALLGIAGGDGKGNFNPDLPLTRQDAMLMVYNVLELNGKTSSNGLTADFSAYLDGDEIDSYAKEAMGSLILMGIVTGDGNGYLSPKRQLNRAEAAVLMHTIMTL